MLLQELDSKNVISVSYADEYRRQTFLGVFWAPHILASDLVLFIIARLSNLLNGIALTLYDSEYGFRISKLGQPSQAKRTIPSIRHFNFSTTKTQLH